MEKKVLVVCIGNACRSQMAEGYLRHYTSQEVKIYSAGINADVLHPLTIQAMEEDGIELAGHHSKSIHSLLDTEFDYVITVCNEAKEQLPPLKGNPKFLHIHFPDPSAIDGSPEAKLEAFRNVREQIKKYILKFVGRTLFSNIGTAA